jgi:hypothetical protein
MEKTRGAVACGTRLVGSYPSPANQTLAEIELGYPIFPRSSGIEVYLHRFRGRIPGADNKHTNPWASNQARPMCSNGIYNAVRRSKWPSTPINVRGVKDLLDMRGLAQRSIT